MPFTVKKRGKLTYYFKGERPVLSSLVTEELPDGDLKISFAGLTGGYSAKNVLEAQFDFHVPFSPVDAKDPNRSMAALFASGGQTRLVFTFKDGNPHADPYEVCFTFARGEELDTWVSTRVPCADAVARR